MIEQILLILQLLLIVILIAVAVRYMRGSKRIKKAEAEYKDAVELLTINTEETVRVTKSVNKLILLLDSVNRGKK